MKITEEKVRYIAELAHLNLSDDEIKAYQGDLEQILNYVDTLNQLDTDGVEPMSHAVQSGSETSVLRDDEPEPSLDRERALMNAPLSGAGHFKVPLVIER